MHGKQYKLIQLAATEAQRPNTTNLPKENVRRIEEALMAFVIKDRQAIRVLDSVYLNRLIDGKIVVVVEVWCAK